MNIIFFGTPDFAMPVLDILKENWDNVFHFQNKTLKDEAVFEEFKNLKPDICIVAAYGKIIPKKFLDIPRYGFVNVHPSLLPKYRGPSPIQTAILNGDNETGVSIMLIDEKVDHGPILAEEKYLIDKNKDLLTTSKELFELGGKLLVKILPEYIAGEIKPAEQDEAQATFTKMFERADGRINWSEPCEKIYNQIRALNPEPGTWTTWPARRSLGKGGKGKVINIYTVTTFKVVSPQGADLVPEEPGMVMKLGGDIAIKTGTGYLILKSIQLEGRKKTDAKDFVNGYPDFLGSTLE